MNWKPLTVGILATALTACAASDWENAGRVLAASQPGASQATLTEGDILQGLREALAQGTSAAINDLGRSDGFWRNTAVRIPLPDTVAKFERPLRQMGQGAAVDEFHLTLNRAAENAVPHVAEIFGNAVRRMTFEDARGILNGAPDAATQFFRRTTSDALHARVYPIVEGATQKVGVTQRYKSMIGSYGPILQMAGLKTADLDSFVTDNALDGLFTMIAAEEARIRRDPAARASEILRRVFGAR